MSGKDPIDQAITAAAAADQAEAFRLQLANLETWQLILNSSGRPLIVATPSDMSEEEVMDLLAWSVLTLATVMRGRRREAAARSIEIVRTMPDTRGAS